MLSQIAVEANWFIAATLRPADAIKIRELELEGLNLSYDEMTCVGYPVQEDAVWKLCADIRQHMVNADLGPDEEKMIPPVTTENLISWQVLKQVEGKLLSTNAFALFTSDYFPFSKI